MPSDAQKTIKDIIEELKNAKVITVSEVVIPSGIIDNHSGKLFYVRTKYSKDGDEALYASNEMLRKYLSRSLTFIELTKANETTVISDYVISGLRKFSGTPADEDSFLSNDCTSIFFDKHVDKTKVIVSIEKINGESALFSGRFIDNVFYLIAGSKNTHIIFNTLDHIDLYTDQRFDLAKKIAKYVLNYWFTLDIETRDKFSQYLDSTKNTVVCELLQPTYQHIVKIENLKDELIAFTICPPPENNLTIDKKSFTAESPVQAIKTLKSFGLKTASYETFLSNKMESKIKETRGKKSTEGSVFYCVDDRNCTIGLMKVKTKWYVVLRALREKTIRVFYSKHKRPNVEYAISEMTTRLKDIQTWILLTDSELCEWNNKFSYWFLFIKENETKYSANQIRKDYPNIWNKFLVEQSGYETILLT